MPTINVLTFNGFENGLACCGSLHGRLKPRRYLVSYLNSYPVTFSPASQKVCTDYLCQIYRPIGLFSVGISSNGRIFGRIMIKPTDCSHSISTSALFCLSVFLHLILPIVCLHSEVFVLPSCWQEAHL